MKREIILRIDESEKKGIGLNVANRLEIMNLVRYEGGSGVFSNNSTSRVSRSLAMSALLKVEVSRIRTGGWLAGWLAGGRPVVPANRIYQLPREAL